MLRQLYLGWQQWFFNVSSYFQLFDTEIFALKKGFHSQIESIAISFAL